MEQNEAIEMQLWEYLDGICTEAERQRIATLVANDAIWQQKLAELNALQAEITAALETEQPSMRFTKNVMEAVSHVQVAPATKKYINNNIIKGIAAFFITVITIVLGYALATTNWHSTISSAPVKPPFKLPDFGTLFSGQAFYMILIVNIVLGLLLIDTLLRRRKDAIH